MIIVASESMLPSILMEDFFSRTKVLKISKKEIKCMIRYNFIHILDINGRIKYSLLAFSDSIDGRTLDFLQIL